MRPSPSSTAPSAPRAAGPRVSPGIAAGVADTAIVLAFAATGRASHGEADPVLGALSTAWPFAVGLALAWALPLVHRRPLSVWPAGVLAWLGAYVVGMLLRAATGQGTAVPFLIVAASVLGVALVGWRAVALGVRAALRRRAEH
ncbi:hypothetical protein J2W21_001511 [Sinomonas atrocyanea]|jgi:hypothetical protein|uniref:DUF3054 domain-containing protein n=1 Tax=Sinomonas atrocyanea TaxID=37927 RepID=UPI00277D34DB|nr:DUF3054 domain-containing protein [Sinomonas atrocyanea]MDP9884017.1 hypothetical protein [Sinomonas atrocyanea]